MMFPVSKGFRHGMLFITSPPERVEMFNIPPIPYELPCFSSFFTNQSQLTGDTSASPPLKSPDHRSTCPTMRHSLGSMLGMKFFHFFGVQIIKAGRWFFIVSTSFTHFSFVILFFFLRRFCVETFLAQYVGSIKTTTWRIGTTCRKTQMLGEFQRIPLNNWDRCKFLWEILIKSCQ